MKYAILIPLAILGILCLFYRFSHPKKSDTELCIDIFNGKMFKWVSE